MNITVNKAIKNLFYPKSIAVAGASGNTKNLGSRTLKLIKKFGFDGKIFAVNPRKEACQGAEGFNRVNEIKNKVDLCIIAVPAIYVQDVVSDCAEKGVPVAQILTGGFGEAGKQGRRLEIKILKKAGGKTRIVGPNCLGVYSSAGKLTFVSSADHSIGKVSIASQSGGLSVDMIMHAKSRGLKLGKVISMGNCIDLGPIDFMNYFTDDPETEVIGLYIEGIRHGENFFTALKNVARQKPVIVLKGGRTSLGAKSVTSHTNSLAGEFAIWKTAVSQAGGVIVDNFDTFMATLTAFQKDVPRLKGKGIALIGNGGGATVLATDFIEERGLTLAQLNESTKAAVTQIKVTAGSTIGNPTDIPVNALNRSGGEALGSVVNCIIKDPCIDGIIVHFNLLPLVNYENRQNITSEICSAILFMKKEKKPIYIALRSVPEPVLEEIRQKILETIREAQFPCFQNINEAVDAMAGVKEWLQRPIFMDQEGFELPAYVIEQARKIIDQVKSKGYRSVPQDTCFDLLSLFGIPHPPMKLARSSSEARAVAAKIGFPVAMKIESPDIMHKSDVEGVLLGLKNEDEVEKGFQDICDSALQKIPGAEISGVLIQHMFDNPVQEMICGLKRDPVFGATVILGLGGIFVEMIRNVAMRISPLTKGETHQMWKETSWAKLLSGYRGRPKVDTDALEDLLQRVAAIGESIPEIKEMDLNPVMVLEEGAGLGAVDCRIIIDY